MRADNRPFVEVRNFGGSPEVWLPDAGEPDLSYVANVVEGLIGDALEGLNQALLGLRHRDANPAITAIESLAKG